MRTPAAGPDVIQASLTWNLHVRQPLGRAARFEPVSGAAAVSPGDLVRPLIVHVWRPRVGRGTGDAERAPLTGHVVGYSPSAGECRATRNGCGPGLRAQLSRREQRAL